MDDEDILETPLYSDLAFRGLRLSDKSISTAVKFRLPISRLYVIPEVLLLCNPTYYKVLLLLATAPTSLLQISAVLLSLSRRLHHLSIISKITPAGYQILSSCYHVALGREFNKPTMNNEC